MSLAGRDSGAAGEQPLIVSPISPVPSGEIHIGKLVWVDLVTTDVRRAEAFYTSVFDWQSTFSADGTYAELSHDGRVISSIALYDGDDAADGDARWLVSISVRDVDAALRRAVASGGELLVPATDLPNRGRFAVIGDSRGAILMLLRATGGDPADHPVDDTLTPDTWGWAELWTDDPDVTVRFYQETVGYDVLRLPDAAGDERLVLGTDGRARATIVTLPWDDVEPNWIPYIPVTDVPDTLRRVTNAGGAVLVESDGSGDSAVAAIVMDPTGGVFAVQKMESGQSE